MEASEVHGALARVPWGVRFTAAILMPWAIAIGFAYAAEILVPGQIKVDIWRYVASASFTVSGLFCACVAFTRQWPIWRRLLLVAVVLVWSLWFAFMFQLRSNCGDELEYIGQVPVAEACE